MITPVVLLLESDELFILRLSVRMMQTFNLTEGDEDLLYRYTEKIISGTNDLDKEWKNEIGKIQRAVKQVPQIEKDKFLKSIEDFNEVVSKYL